jgi:hypothetical protein
MVIKRPPIFREVFPIIRAGCYACLRLRMTSLKEGVLPYISKKVRNMRRTAPGIPICQTQQHDAGDQLPGGYALSQPHHDGDGGGETGRATV